MATVVTLSFLLGAFLGLRFRVFVLIPLTASLGIVAIAVGLATHVSAAACLVGYGLSTILLQGGYLVGSIARPWIVVGRMARTFPRPMKAAPGHIAGPGARSTYELTRR